MQSRIIIFFFFFFDASGEVGNDIVSQYPKSSSFQVTSCLAHLPSLWVQKVQAVEQKVGVCLKIGRVHSYH